MKTLKRESEVLQKKVREALDDLQNAYNKLDVLYGTEPMDSKSAECLLHAQHLIQESVAWLHKEYGEEEEIVLCPRITSAWEQVDGGKEIRFKHENFTDL